MLDSPLTWGAIIIALGSLVAAIKFWMDMGKTAANAEAARTSANEAHKRIDEIAKSAATNEDIAAAEQRFTDAVNGIRGDFRHMAGRLDQVLVTLAQKA